MMIPFRDDNPHTSFPLVTLTLIIINSVVFLFEVSLGAQTEQFIASFGMVPRLVGQGYSPTLSVNPYLTFLTSMFLHGGWLHLIGNMLYLWIFGDNVEHAMGRIRFLIFYLAAGLSAGLTHFFFNQNSGIPTVGASGAIAGVLGAYLNLYPRARVQTAVPFGFYLQIITLPAVVVLGFWFVMQLISAGMTPKGVAGVAYGAHIGGFIAGYALVRRFCKKEYKYFKR